MTDNDKNDDRYTVPALARGLQLLMQFNRDERELSGAELSRRLGLPRASVFRMLFTLEQGGFVERAEDGVSYRLGLSVLRLGFELLASMELTEYGRPVIEELRDRCGYSAHVVVRDAREVVFIAMSRQIGFSLKSIGERLPAYRTGRLSAAQMVEAMHERIAQIDAQMAALRAQRRRIVDHVAWLRAQAKKKSKSPSARGRAV